jgi:ubiquinone/menaquinone biosynthesis C-methylase UbiE
MLVQPTHDEYNRQAFIQDLRMRMLEDIGGGVKTVYEARVKPAFVKKHGRPPATEHEVHDVMMDDLYTQTWSSMTRTWQEMFYDSTVETVDRELPSLIERYRASTSKFASLTLDPEVKVPRYISAVDIHLMPGNYHTERIEDDVAQGALYDQALFVYQAGAAGPYCDSNGRTFIAALREAFPDFKPKRILDLGCTAGNNTLPWAHAFPDAEVHAVDVGAPCVRYAKARAEALEAPVHFHQMNAEELAFEDGSFDLVISCLLFHETSRKGLAKILAESHRVLSPSGITLHMETPRTNNGMDPFDAFYMDWDSYFNNEPFMQQWTSTDMVEACAKAGFEREDCLHIVVPDVDQVSPEVFRDAVHGRRAAGRKEVGHWGEAIDWHMYGARKA